MSSPEIAIAGLTVRIVPESAASYIGGPVPGAAAGARAVGLRVSCRTAIGNDLNEFEAQHLVRLVGGAITSVDRPQPRFRIRSGTSGRCSDDVRPFRYPSEPLPSDSPVVLANGDPQWHLELLERSGFDRPILIDCYSDWQTIRQRELAHCLAAATIITATEAELDLMQGRCRDAIARTLTKGGILVRKRACEGVVLQSARASLALPAPDVAKVTNEIGAGDVLAGALALALITGPPTIETVAKAYGRARPVVARVLSGEMPWNIAANQ